ncbi:GNAT family N-acetyltransferase [Kitasatospora nipponensis]|uniref:GNAT family N-acetyltransferase n=1 Tax=Kitasatospora nipponensis TaxID=258049 RepID=A0ABP4HD37_9ACTN
MTSTATTPATPAWRVRRPVAGDFAAWRDLFRQYGEFYRVEMPEERFALVWSWIGDPAHEVECLLVVDAADRPVGLAHVRPFARPLAGAVGGYLDDLFVDPAARGGGAVDALLAELRALAAERGWNTVRWITADDNHRARAKYDQVATRTMFVTYDMPPGGPQG